jgi:hypothetical protein
MLIFFIDMRRCRKQIIHELFSNHMRDDKVSEPWGFNSTKLERLNS